METDIAVDVMDTAFKAAAPAGLEEDPEDRFFLASDEVDLSTTGFAAGDICKRRNTMQ